MEITEVVTGTLRGMGCDVDCTLLITRPARQKMYSHCTVLQAPRWLPDGYYEATFLGQSAFLHRGNGAWSVGVPWERLPSTRKAVPEAEHPVPEWMRTLAG